MVLVMGLVAGIGAGRAVLLILGPQVDIHVTKGFMISPEAMFLTDTEFTGVSALPGVIFNYLGNGFFAGAGVILPVSISDGLGAGNLLPKFNLGYRGRHVNLTAYLITSTEAMFSLNLIGASIGYRF
jgi:hypothetical protein